MTEKKIIRNFFLLSSGQVFSQFIVFLSLAYLARVIGPESLGKIGFTQVFVSYFIFFSDLGLNLHGVREIAKDRGKMREMVNTILSIRLSFAVLVFSVLAVTDFLIFKESVIRFLVIVYGLTIFTFALGLDFLFMGINKSSLIGIVNSIRAVVFLGLIMLLVESSNDLYEIALIFLFSYVVSTVAYFVFAKISVEYSLHLFWNPKRWKEVVMSTLPLGVMSILSLFTQQQSILLLGIFYSTVDVGLYYGMFKIVMMAIFIIEMYGYTIYPMLIDPKNGNILIFSVKLIIFLVVPAILLMNVFDIEIIKIVLGAEYTEGDYVFKMLIWIIPLTAIFTVLNRSLIAQQHDRKCLIANVYGFIAGTLASIFLIPKFGMIGAASSFILSLVLVNVIMGYFVLRINKLSLQTSG